MASARRRGYCRNFVSVLACLLTSSGWTQPVITETTGPLAYYGASTRKVKPADNIIIDSTVTTSTIMTTASLSVMPDYPLRFDDVAGGLRLRGTGGIWGFSDSWALTRDDYPDLYSLIAHYNPSGGNRMAINTDVATTTGTASLTLGPGGNVGGDEAPYYLIMRDYLGVNAMSVDRDGNMDVLGNIVSQADITAGTTFIVDDVTINDSGMDIVSGNVSIGIGNVTVSSGTIVVTTGKIQTVFGPIISTPGGSPFADPQVAIIATAVGGIAGYNIGSEEDVHAGVSMYAKRSFVAGRGAQHFGHDGAVVITTNGSGTAPYPGFARGSIYADQNGVRYTVLDSASPYRGSLGSWHNYDATVATSGSLETSNTLNIGATCEDFVSISLGSNSVTVFNSQIVGSDVVLTTYAGDDNDGGALWVDSIVNNTSFVVHSTNNVSDDTDVNWKIIH